MPDQMRSVDWLMLAILSVLWGGSFLFVGIAVTDLPPFTIVAGRVVLAGAILVLAVRLTGHVLPHEPRQWRDFLVLALLGNTVPFSLIAWGQHHIPSGLAAILNATTPLFTVLLLRLAGEGRIGLMRAAGLLAGLAGVGVLMGPKAFTGATLGLAGAAAVLLAAFSYGLSGLWARRFRSMPSLVTAAGTMLAASVEVVPLALAIDRPWALSPGWPALASVVALAVFGSALAYLLFYRIMSRAGPANATLVTFLVPVTAILMGWAVLDERLPWNAFAGMALIFLGLAAIDGRAIRWVRGGRNRAAPAD